MDPRNLYNLARNVLLSHVNMNTSGTQKDELEYVHFFSVYPLSDVYCLMSFLPIKKFHTLVYLLLNYR